MKETVLIKVPQQRELISEENSSEYVIDAHNRQIERITDMSEVWNTALLYDPFDSVIYQVPHLKSLDVSFNKLKKLENINELKELKEIKAYNNQLSKITGIEG